LTTSIGRIVALSDGVGITDTIGVLRGVLVSLSESVGITDSLSRAGTFVRSITENVGITDTFSRSIAYVRTISDTVGITDIFSAAKLAKEQILLLLRSLLGIPVLSLESRVKQELNLTSEIIVIKPEDE
jgi:hypothetical protein